MFARSSTRKRYYVGAALALLLIAVIAAGTALQADAAPLSLPSGITAYWKLDEANGNRVDLVGGLVLSDTNTVTQAGGKHGFAAQFTASNQEYLSIADNAALSTGDINYTWSAWFMPDGLGVTRPILAKWNSAPNGEYLLHVTSNFPQLVIANGTGSDTISWSSAITQTATWYFVVAWHDATNNEICISLNNGTPNCLATTISPTDRSESFRIGGRDSNNAWWDGRVDSVGFWKRVLTSDERARLWNGGAGCDYPFADCEVSSLTATPTTTAAAPTSTPSYLVVQDLDSGNQLWIERRWTWGDLFTALAVVAFAALFALRWVFDLVVRETASTKEG